MGFAIFAAVVVVLIAALFAVDWANSERQRLRLNNGQRQEGVDEFRVRNDRIVNASFASFSGKSVTGKNKRN